MNTLKKLALIFMSAGIMLTGCGRSAQSDTSIPDGIVEITPTTQAAEDIYDNYDEYENDEPDIVTTYVYEPETYIVTTTVRRRGKAYVASERPAAPIIRTVTTAAQDTTAPPEQVVTTAPVRTNTRTTRTVTVSSPRVTTSAPPATAVIRTAPTTVKVTAPPTTAVQVTTTTYAGISPGEQLKKLTLRQKVSQLFIVTPDQLSGVRNTTEANTTMKRTIADIPVGGVVFGEDNLTSKKQLSTLLLNMSIYFNSSTGIDPLITVCEEGGDRSPVSKKLLTTSFYEPSVYGKENDPEHVQEIGSIMGQELLKLGFRLNLAPDADITGNGYSTDENITAGLVKSMIRGLKESGVYAAAGNFPGTDNRSGRTVKQLRAVEYVPYKAAIEEGVVFITMGHQVVSGFGDSLPADLSPKVVGSLRNELGFSGIIVSGDMSSEAITDKYSSGEAAVASIKAGVDMIYLPEDLKEAVDAVCKAVEEGDISEERINESVLRVLIVKKAMGL